MTTSSFVVEGWMIIAVSIVIPLLASLIFATWIADKFQTNDERIKAWDVFLKGVGSLTAIVAGVLAILQYIHTTKQSADVLKEDLAQKTREFNINLYKNADKEAYKTTLYHEVVDIASAIANADTLNTPEMRIATNRFFRMYSGQLVVVKEEKVRDAMTDFRAALLVWQKTPDRKPTIDRATAEKLLKAYPNNNSKAAAMIGEDSQSIEQALAHLKDKPGNRLDALCLLLSDACREELMQADRDVIYDVVAADLNNYVFCAGLIEEWYRSNWTSQAELEGVVPDYNKIITKLRTERSSRRAEIERYWSQSVADEWDAVMESILKVNSAVHGLNEETGLVVARKKERADDEIAKQVAAKITAELEPAKEKVSNFLSSLNGRN